jgi:hypothetical protein
VPGCTARRPPHKCPSRSSSNCHASPPPHQRDAAPACALPQAVRNPHRSQRGLCEVAARSPTVRGFPLRAATDRVSGPRIGKSFQPCRRSSPSACPLLFQRSTGLIEDRIGGSGAPAGAGSADETPARNRAHHVLHAPQWRSRSGLDAGTVTRWREAAGCRNGCARPAGCAGSGVGGFGGGCAKRGRGQGSRTNRHGAEREARISAGPRSNSRSPSDSARLTVGGVPNRTATGRNATYCEAAWARVVKPREVATGRRVDRSCDLRRCRRNTPSASVGDGTATARFRGCVG